MSKLSQRRISRGTANGLFALALSMPALSFPAYEDPGSWIGIGARVRPAYQGADSSRADVIPYLRGYGQHFFARTTQGMLEGGVRTSAFGPWIFGAQLAYEEGRVTDESAFLKAHNFDDLDPGVSVGLHVEADWMLGPMPWNALVRFRQNLDSDRGAQADIRATAGIFSRGGFDVGAFAQLTWADTEAMQRYFGITSQQSVVTGLPAYNAGAGASAASFGLVGSIDVGRPWIVLCGAQVQQLQGDARGAPIVQDRTNWYANIGIGYRF